MYEARRGDFRYTIERRFAEEGGHIWRWQVTRGAELIESGASPRSHTHAETAALAVIFQAERREQAYSIRRSRTPSWSSFCPQ